VKKILLLLFFFNSFQTFAQSKIDTVVYNVIYRDTVIYVKSIVEETRSDMRINNWGVGPIVGAAYSPFTGFDVKIGFGLQYNLFYNRATVKNHPKKKK
jgi:hypothetical protein